MSLSAFGQAIVASLISAGILGIIVRVVFERSITHVLDRRLREYEAQLQERTALRTSFGEQRLDGYRSIITEVRHTGRALRDCLEAESDERLSVVEKYHKATGDLQEALYDNALTLQQDGLYRRVDTFKVDCRTLTKSLRNAARSIAAADVPARADAETVWHSLHDTAGRLLSEVEDIAMLLQKQIDSTMQGQK
jgi:hypothetical protein